jgi:hypothetical protein
MTYQPSQSEDVTLKCLPNGVQFDKDGNPRERYVRIGYDGSWCVCKPSEVADMTADAEPGKYELRDVFYSRQEIEAMPEFEGW